MDNEAKVTAIYCRKEKIGDHTENEKLLLQNYAAENGFQNIEYFIEDSVWGTGVVRPTYLNMLIRVCSGEIGTIIVKEHSVFGGNKFVSKQILDEIIDDYDVRYIAVADHIDSSKGWDDIVDYSELIKSLYIKDKTVKVDKEKQKKAITDIRLSKTAFYGYRTNPENPRELIIDDEAAEVIRSIFKLCAEGHGIGQIVNVLNNEHILVPSAYMYERGIISKTRPSKNPYIWSHMIVTNILNNKLYVGEPIYKKDTSEDSDAEKYPAIIDRATWDTVEQICKYNRKPSKYGMPGYFSGIAVCPACGNTLSYHPRMVRNKFAHFYTCSTYNRSKGCTAHYISEQALMDIVLHNLKQVIKIVNCEQSKFEKLVLDDDKENIENTITNNVDLINHYKNHVDKLYISMKYFMKNKDFNETEQKIEELQDEINQFGKNIKELEMKTSVQKNKLSNLAEFISIAREEIGIDELSLSIIDKFIKSIVVYDAKNASRKNKDQRVDIIYNYIGCIYASSETF